MARVLDPTPQPSAEKEVICGSCGAKIAYVENDLKEEHGKDYSGGHAGREWIVCPNCNKKITIRNW